MRRLCVVTIACALCSAAARGQGETSTPNPSAPPEVRQYQFMLGDWIGHTTSDEGIGALPRREVRWHGTYILDGWAFRTDWEIRDGDGTIQRGTMIRAFEPARHEWRIAETYSLRPTLEVFSGRQTGDSLVQWSRRDTPAGPVLARRVYFNIGRDCFEDRVENSRDGGRTWTVQFQETYDRVAGVAK